MVRGNGVDNFATLGFAIIAGSVLMWLASAVWAVIDVTRSRSLSLYWRIVWSFVVVFVPVLGSLAWLVTRTVRPAPHPAAAR
jgi:Phospholipase_D-nuclease N-terminal